MVLFCFEADSVLFVLLSSPLVGKFLVLPLVSMRCVLRNNMEPQGEVSSMHNTIKGEAGGKCNKRNQSASHVSVQVVLEHLLPTVRLHILLCCVFQCFTTVVYIVAITCPFVPLLFAHPTCFSSLPSCSQVQVGRLYIPVHIETKLVALPPCFCYF